MVVQYMAASEANSRSDANGLRPADWAPLVGIRELRVRWHGLCGARRRSWRWQRWGWGQRCRANCDLFPALCVQTRKTTLLTANTAAPMAAVGVPLTAGTPLLFRAREGRREPLEVRALVAAAAAACQDFRAPHLGHARLLTPPAGSNRADLLGNDRMLLPAIARPAPVVRRDTAPAEVRHTLAASETRTVHVPRCLLQRKVCSPW
mmetsp:Transcript_46196/g.100382  ORF Transcript_46196/g.100382 Transcript_46196/m.100382 type:complete len:206 (+) Transcript_46196:1125-1742(+)